MKNRLIYNFFSDDDFLRISNQIKKSEQNTSGEIRISIKEKRLFWEFKKDIKNIAEKEFRKLGMANTRDKTGILLFLLLGERKFYILADEGINNKVSKDTWDKVRDEIQINFREGKFASGIIQGIERVGNILSEHFPIRKDDTNELSNKVILD
ncbi:MAG: TPM domain-containing protein [Ignavibacteria bacterium]|nr:TPM domain-containing protein [Ignavibacteria bacterium]